jgi:hypothetical protein
MNELHQIQAAIRSLPSAEIRELSGWLEEYLADLWDQQIERDILAGRLDDMGRQADQDFDAGRCTSLVF